MESQVLGVAGVELSLEGDIVICHPQQLAVLQFIRIDVRAIARRVRVLLIEFPMSDYFTSPIKTPPALQSISTRSSNKQLL